MFDTFKNNCQFIFIYINEAHAMDEWPIRTKNELCIKQHQTLQDRYLLAKSLTNTYQFALPIYVDTMENIFQNTYAAWPLIAFIVQDGKIDFMLEPRSPGYYSFKDLYAELIQRFSSNI
jgi:type I thyroxine 5'-deiodinase